MSGSTRARTRAFIAPPPLPRGGPRAARRSGTGTRRDAGRLAVEAAGGLEGRLEAEPQGPEVLVGRPERGAPGHHGAGFGVEARGCYTERAHRLVSFTGVGWWAKPPAVFSAPRGGVLLRLDDRDP